MSAPPPPGWYPTPEPATDPYPYRWWDGEGWAAAPNPTAPPYGAPLQAGAAAPARRPSYLPSIVAAVGGVLIFVGALLPWITVSSVYVSFSRSGIDFNSDGVMELVLGIVAVAAAGVRLLGPTWRWVGFALAVFVGGVSLAVGLYDLHLVDGRLTDIDALGFAAFHGGVGAGIILVLVGGAVVLAAAALALVLEVAGQRGRAGWR